MGQSYKRRAGLMHCGAGVEGLAAQPWGQGARAGHSYSLGATLHTEGHCTRSIGVPAGVPVRVSGATYVPHAQPCITGLHVHATEGCRHAQAPHT